MRLLLAGIVVLGGSLCLAEPPRGANLLRDPSFEDLGRTEAPWKAVGKGYTPAPDGQEGKASVMCGATAADESRGIMQEVVFDPPIRHPFKVSGWSKAENAGGADYCLYMDCWYDDGTNLWGQRMNFAPGTHDWQKIEYVFDPARPVTKIQYFILFRRCTGRAWFDNVSLSLAPFVLEKEKTRSSLYGGNSIDYSAYLSLPARWTASVLKDGREMRSTSGQGRGVNFAWAGTDGQGRLLPGGAYTVRVAARDDLRQEELRHEIGVQTQSGEGRGYIAWTDSSMNRVLINSWPENPGAGLAAQIALAGNEYESFQVAVRTAPERELRDCVVTLSDLRGTPTRPDALAPVISRSNIEWHQVGFVKLDALFNHPELPTEAVPGWWPDPLLPVGKFSVAAGTTQALWFTVYAPPQTPAGDYEGRVSITPANGPGFTATVKATVYGFDVPAQPHIKTAFALMDGYLEKLYGRLTPALRRAYGDYALRHRLNPDDISRTDPPDIEDIAHYNDRGLNAYNVINMVEPRGKRAWICWSPLNVYTPKFKEDLIRRLDPVVAELKRRGLADKAYVYTFDERGKDFWPTMKEYFGLIKERYGIPTLTTAKVPQDPQVMKDLNVDWNCPLTPVYNLAEADACRKAGLQVWAYVCCGPRHPYANWLADDPLIEARVIWWQAYHQKMDGLLYWGLNIWSRANNDYLIDPEKDGPFLKWSITTERFAVPLHGDGDLLYAGKEGPYGCIRLANIRDGIEDYEYLWRLASLENDVEKARDACLPVTADMRTFTRNPAEVYDQRQKIARRIEALLGKSPLR